LSPLAGGHFEVRHHRTLPDMYRLNFGYFSLPGMS
jgi:hypothetical protein